MFVLLNLLTAADPPPRSADRRLPSTRRSGGPPASQAAGDSGFLDRFCKGDRPDILLTVDPATKLLSGIDLKIDPPRRSKAGQNVTIEKFGWTSGAVSTQLAKDRSFAFESPKGFARSTRCSKAEEKDMQRRESWANPPRISP